MRLEVCTCFHHDDSAHAYGRSIDGGKGYIREGAALTNRYMERLEIHRTCWTNKIKMMLARIMAGHDEA